MPKRTYQPKKRHRSKKHGFRARIKAAKSRGKSVFKSRKQKGRARLTH